jgi:hypothetical protein
MNTATPTFNVDELHEFHGTDHFYQHPLMRSVIYTDGVQYVAERAGAYWLLDVIATSQLLAAVRAEEFQVWKLDVHAAPATDALLTCDDGNGNVVYSREIHLTDFPAPGIKLYFENGTICLPGER